MESTMTVTISRLYDDYATASEVVRELQKAGFRRDDISLIANNAENWYSSSPSGGEPSGRVDRDRDGTDYRAEGAGAGAAVGAGVLGTAGLLAGLGIIAIPGVGPVVAAGWLASTLAGAAAGAATGGLIGALTQAGVSEEDAHLYAEGVRRGGTLVSVRVPEADRARAEAILDRSTVNLRDRGKAYRQSGWSRFDPKGAPYTAEQVRSERQRYSPPGTTPAGATCTVTALFESRGPAAAAVQRLHASGIPNADVRMVEGRSGATSTQNSTGFWDSLKDLFIPDEDRSTYAEGLRRGGFLVTARTIAPLYGKAHEILDDEGAVDIDQRAASWRTEGWMPGTSTPSSSSGARRGEDVIPVMEEQLKVGKRDISHGRVRVRSYVVESPVHEQVNLREDHVHVERRPVDRPATGSEQLFQERIIEAEERAEEAVVQKQARVKEEVVLKKEAEQHTETVADKVRRTEVKVEDERTPARQSDRRTR